MSDGSRAFAFLRIASQEALGRPAFRTLLMIARVIVRRGASSRKRLYALRIVCA